MKLGSFEAGTKGRSYLILRSTVVATEGSRRTYVASVVNELLFRST